MCTSTDTTRVYHLYLLHGRNGGEKDNAHRWHAVWDRVTETN